jgi:hypothetical protein
MPKTRTQIAAEIHDYCTANRIDRSDSAVRRMAVKWKRREEETGETLDFFTGLRILGITEDPTPLEAVKNMGAIA